MGAIAVIVGSQIATIQVTATTTATQLVPIRRERKTLLLVNDGTNDVYIGDNTVTPTTGCLLAANDKTEIATSAAVYGIVLAGTQVISILETYS